MGRTFRLLGALFLVVGVLASLLAPTASAEDRGTVTTTVLVADGRVSAGVNDRIDWTIEVSCVSDAAGCGLTTVQDVVPAGLEILAIDIPADTGYAATTSQVEGPDGPTTITLLGSRELLHGETLGIRVATRVGPSAAPLTGWFDHIVTTTSSNATPPTIGNPAPVEFVALPAWRVEQAAPVDAATTTLNLGVNFHHRVAVCSPTAGTVPLPPLDATLALPEGVTVVEADGAVVVGSTLTWALPAVDYVALAAEQGQDEAAGRMPDYCIERFPIVRYAEPTFALDQAVFGSFTISDPAAAGSEAAVCAATCRSDQTLVLSPASTLIGASTDGPASVSPGGLAVYDATFDASTATDEVTTPILTLAMPVGHQIHELALRDLPVAARIHPSVDGGATFLPLPLDTGIDLSQTTFGRADFDAAVGAGVAIDAVQIRYYDGLDERGTPRWAYPAGSASSAAVVAVADPAEPFDTVALFCASPSAANAAPADGAATVCTTTQVTEPAAAYGVAAEASVPGAPGDEVPLRIDLVIPTGNGAPIVDPVFAVDLPAGVEFVRFDGVTTTPGLSEVPTPHVEHRPTGDREDVTLSWTARDDGGSTAHTVVWTAAEMIANGWMEDGRISADLTVRIGPGVPAGPVAVGVSVAAAGPSVAGCPGGGDAVTGDGAVFETATCRVEVPVEVLPGVGLAADGWIQTVVSTGPTAPSDSPDVWCPLERLDDIDLTTAPCAATLAPNTTSEVRIDLVNTGNLPLQKPWWYLVLPTASDVDDSVGIPFVPNAEARPSGDWSAGLVGPLAVTELDRADGAARLQVEYSTAAEPCRGHLQSSAATSAEWPLGCVDDWSATPTAFSEVTAVRVHLPIEQGSFDGGERVRLEGTLVVPTDAPFESEVEIASAAIAQSPDLGIDVLDVATPLRAIIPSEAEILAADPDLLGHDLALVARLDEEASPELHDGPASGDAAVFAIEIVNQGSSVGAVGVVAHLDDDLVATEIVGTVRSEAGAAIGYRVDAADPGRATIELTGELVRGDRVTVPLTTAIVDTWSDGDLGLIAEIFRFDDADALPGDAPSVDVDSIPDADPSNDRGPIGPFEPGDDVTSGNGLSETGDAPDPVAHDEDDHDLAGVPIWDLAIALDRAAGQAPTIEWSDPVARWSMTLTNQSARPVHDVVVGVEVPAGMRWAELSGSSTEGVVATQASDGSVTLTIPTLTAEAGLTVEFSTVAEDLTFDEYPVRVVVRSFDVDETIDNTPSLLAVDADPGDDAAVASVRLPHDLALTGSGDGPVALPAVPGRTAVDIGFAVTNEGRPVDAATVRVELEHLVHDTGVPLVVERSSGDAGSATWQVADDGSSVVEIDFGDLPLVFGETARIVVPSLLGADWVTGALRLDATVLGIEAGLESVVDDDPSDDAVTFDAPVWDLALDIVDGVDQLDRIGSSFVATWTVVVTNEGTQDAHDIVLRQDVPDGMAWFGPGEVLTGSSRVTAEAPTGTEGSVMVALDHLSAGESVTFELHTVYLDDVEGRYQSTIQIASFASAAGPDGAAADDIDSTPAALGDGDLDEDDADRHTTELPVEASVALRHVDIGPLPMRPGSTTVRFDVDVTSTGRPLREMRFLLDIDPAQFDDIVLPDASALVVDDGDGDELAATWTRVDGAIELLVVGVNETRGGGVPVVDRQHLDPGETITIPLELVVAAQWDGRALEPTVSMISPLPNVAVDAQGAVSIWDLALEVEAGGLQRNGDAPDLEATWTVTVENQGNRDAHDIGVVTTVPVGMVWGGLVDEADAVVSTSATPGAAGIIVQQIDRIEAGERVSFEYRTRLVESDRAVFETTAEVSWFDSDDDDSNPIDPLARDIDSTPDLDPTGDPWSSSDSLAFDPDGDGNRNEVMVDAAGAVIDEDDHSAAMVTLEPDARVEIAIDTTATTFPITAGSSVTARITIENQGVDADGITVDLAVDGAWTFGAGDNPDGLSTGDATLAYRWDLTAPSSPKLRIAGGLASGDRITVPVTYALPASASGSDGAPTVSVTVREIDDDGDDTTTAPSIVDAAGDAVDSLSVPVLDLAATIAVAESVSQPVATGETVVFDVEIHNQGSTHLTDLRLTSIVDTTVWAPFAASANPLGSSGGDAALTHQWSADGDDGDLALTGRIAPGDTISVPLALTLRADADLSAARVVVELTNAIAVDADGVPVLHADGTAPVDIDSTPDDDPTNDSQPAEPGDATDDVIDNTGGDEDDHDIAGLTPLSYSIGNQIWFDADDDGIREDGELPAAGVLVEIYRDTDRDGLPDDVSGDGVVGADDLIASATSDVDGLWTIDGLGAGSYVVEIPASQFATGAVLDGWGPAASPSSDPNDGVDGDTNGWLVDGRIRTATVDLDGNAPRGETPGSSTTAPDARADLTIDFGLVQFSVGNEAWLDADEDGQRDETEEPFANATVYLLRDADSDGTPDDLDNSGRIDRADAVLVTATDAAGLYLFDGVPSGRYVVGLVTGALGLERERDYPSSNPNDGVDGDNNGLRWTDGVLVSSAFFVGFDQPTGEAPDNDERTPDTHENLTVDLAVRPAPLPQVGPDGPTPPQPVNNLTQPYVELQSLAGWDLDWRINGVIDRSGVEGGGFDVGPGTAGPAGPLAFTGGNSRALASWGAMFIVLGAVLVFVTRDPE